MKTEHIKPKREKWEIAIYPYEDYGLYEDAPHDENTRAIFQLVEPIRLWLDSHEFKITIDRGDWGEGDEHFYITLYSKSDFENLKQLCKSLSKPKPLPTEEEKVAWAELQRKLKEYKANKLVAKSDGD